MAKFFLRLALLGLVMSSAACEDREVSLMILQMQPIVGCEPTSDETFFQSQGVIDIAFIDSYSVYPLLENKMIDINAANNYGEQDARANTNSVLLRQAIIEYEFIDPISGDFETVLPVEMSGFVPIGDSKKVVGLELMPLSQIERLRAAPELGTTDGRVQIMTRVRLKGETLDGKSIESNEFKFPVIICLGCRLRCSQQEMDLLASEGLGNVDTTIECPAYAGQDDNFIDCISCPQLLNESIQAKICPVPSQNTQPPAE